jgi:hypothetical protein
MRENPCFEFFRLIKIHLGCTDVTESMFGWIFLSLISICAVFIGTFVQIPIINENKFERYTFHRRPLLRSLLNLSLFYRYPILNLF